MENIRRALLDDTVRTTADLSIMQSSVMWPNVMKMMMMRFGGVGRVVGRLRKNRRKPPSTSPGNRVYLVLLAACLLQLLFEPVNPLFRSVASTTSSIHLASFTWPCVCGGGRKSSVGGQLGVASPNQQYSAAPIVEPIRHC